MRAASTGSPAPRPRMRCVQQPRIPIYFGGASDAAIAVSAKHADVYALWGETHDQVREITARLRAEAAKHGRTVRVSLSLRPILAPTEDEAWARAEAIKQRIIERRAESRPRPTQTAPTRARDACSPPPRRASVWTSACGLGAALLTGASGNTTSLVGTPQPGGGGVVRILRPGRHHLPDPRLQSVGRQHRLRPQPAAADKATDRRKNRRPGRLRPVHGAIPARVAHSAVTRPGFPAPLMPLTALGSEVAGQIRTAR